jgi:hypothetical protein
MATRTLTSRYPSALFGVNQSTPPEIESLFRDLMCLDPMDKNGSMSGRCDSQTDQMERFLSQTFGFKTIRGQYIVPGVSDFKLDRPPHLMPPDIVISFPQATSTSFSMTAQEISQWQRSYRIYADINIRDMDKEFLHRAVQGGSQNGEEAFRMKFVVRISTCPILMEFDGKTIPRKITEPWPNKIKLVSVTGIDFAGRIHDVGDIRYYISNWREVFNVDPKTGLMIVNGRDFHPTNNGRPAKLHEDRVIDSLLRMARLRLRACDAEGVQVVVETGIGLGVFSGEHIGIGDKVRKLSAYAIRRVLQEDGLSYRNIRAIVFALPIFNSTRSSRRSPDTYSYFENEFCQARYNGPIPVMIADQDMHRLTVAIARLGFVVSELNPADSHGVFGEYWQNHGPAVEEKIALTTAGLLVQHHLINPHVLNANNHHFI